MIVCGQGFLEAMLDPQMKNMIGASQAQVGIAFLLLGGSYLVTSVAAGFVSFNISQQLVVCFWDGFCFADLRQSPASNCDIHNWVPWHVHVVFVPQSGTVCRDDPVCPCHQLDDSLRWPRHGVCRHLNILQVSTNSNPVRVWWQHCNLHANVW